MRHAQRAALVRELDTIKIRLRRHGLNGIQTISEYIADIKRRDEIEALLTGAPP